MREPQELPTLFDERQTAILLHVKPCTVRNERLRGKLGYVRVGRRILYTGEQIRSYLQQNSIEVQSNNSVQPNLISMTSDDSEPLLNRNVKPTVGRSPGLTLAERRASSELGRVDKGILRQAMM
jgi:hypothetical protein